MDIAHPFQKTQQDFTQRIRRPLAHNPLLPELEKRMAVYRRLLRGNISNFVDTVFPVAQALLPGAVWRQLVEHFFEHGQCDSPFYYDISCQFKDHVVQLDWSSLQSYPWLAELLHFEWLELYVEMGEELDHMPAPNGDDEVRLIQPCWPLVYHWPVHEWTTQTAIHHLAPRLCCLLIRLSMRQRMQVQEISSVTATLLEYIRQQDMTTISTLSATLTQQLMAAQSLSSQQAGQQVEESLRWLCDQQLIIAETL